MSAHTVNNFDKALELLHRPARSRLQSRYNRHLRRAWDAGMQTPFSASHAAERFPQIEKRYVALAGALIKREKELETALDRMAQEEVVRTSDCVYTLYASTGTWVYSSQGFGALTTRQTPHRCRPINSAIMTFPPISRKYGEAKTNGGLNSPISTFGPKRTAALAK